MGQQCTDLLPHLCIFSSSPFGLLDRLPLSWEAGTSCWSPGSGGHRLPNPQERSTLLGAGSEGQRGRSHRTLGGRQWQEGTAASHQHALVTALCGHTLGWVSLGIQRETFQQGMGRSVREEDSADRQWDPGGWGGTGKALIKCKVSVWLNGSPGQGVAGAAGGRGSEGSPLDWRLSSTGGGGVVGGEASPCRTPCQAEHGLILWGARMVLSGRTGKGQG